MTSVKVSSIMNIVIIIGTELEGLEGLQRNLWFHHLPKGIPNE